MNIIAMQDGRTSLQNDLRISTLSSLGKFKLIKYVRPLASYSYIANILYATAYAAANRITHCLTDFERHFYLLKDILALPI